MKEGQKVQTPDGVGLFHSRGPTIGLVAYPYECDGDPASTLLPYDVRTLAPADADAPATPVDDIDPAPWTTRMSNDYVAEHIPDSPVQ